MSILILSGGRTGTNMALEILRGSNKLSATSNIHDEQTVKNGYKVSNNYLSKADTDSLSYEEICRFLDNNSNIKVIWTMRHPFDLMMCKIVRGQPNTEGRGNWLADDATPEKCIGSIMYMHDLYKKIKDKYGDRIMLIKMEDIILDTEKLSKQLADFCEVEYNDSMPLFFERMRNKHKKKRYKSVDKSQINLFKNINKSYDGFFKTYKPNIQELFKEIEGLVEYYDYAR